MNHLFKITKKIKIHIILMVLLPFVTFAQSTHNSLQINELDYFETTGVNVLVFSNWYDGNFSDSKISSIEIIHHGVRTATNGDVRFNPTPEQWDIIPKFLKREIDRENNRITAYLTYPDYNFDYKIQAEHRENGLTIAVALDKPLPNKLKGVAGFNLEFLPAAYFEKSYLMDGKPGFFPLSPAGPMKVDSDGHTEPLPLAMGKRLILAPEDPMRRISVSSQTAELSLYDGRNKAQNGWFVLRELLPGNKTGKVIEWTLEINSISSWIREPGIRYSQVGYHPKQQKVAVIELDKNDTAAKTAKLLKISSSGNMEVIFETEPKSWGNYLRYKYYTFDFSKANTEGLYAIEYSGTATKPFRIGEDVFSNTWQPTLDVFFPVQMAHMTVNEAYRVWHGAAHLDDALQAPVNHEHFDLYAQGPTTDSPYQPGEHIPGLNIGGWFDAGDYDIRTQTQYYVILNLVQIWERFGINRDETLVDYPGKFVDMHHPDGKADILQQIEHGTLALLAQHRSVGHAIAGIIVPDLSQYTHLGDALTMTDNLIYNPDLEKNESDGFHSGKFDDRWAFTTRSSALNYGSIAALAAASRALAGYNDTLAAECLKTAQNVWTEEHSHDPFTFHHGNTTGGRIESEELKAAVELLICTKEIQYTNRINELFTLLQDQFFFNTSSFVRALPHMNETYKRAIREIIPKYNENLKNILQQNPFGVPISTGGWAGNGWVVGSGINHYLLHKAFPDLINPDYIYRCLDYIYGCHPGSNISFVSGVGTVSKKVAYGSNRVDFSFIPGGVVPGVLILKPDFPENKEDWPYLWGENEYVISLGSSYLYLVQAALDLLSE